MIVDGDGRFPVAVHAVPAVVQPVEIPREGALGQLALRRVDDIVVHAAEVDLLKHITAHGRERRVERIGVVGAGVVRLIGAVFAEHRVERVALRVRHLSAEEIRAVVRELDLDQVVLEGSLGRAPLDGVDGLIGIVFICAHKRLIAGDIDGDRRHDEVQSIAVDIAREPGFSRLGGAEVQRTRVPGDRDGVAVSCVTHQVHAHLRGQARFEEQIRIEGAGDGAAVCLGHRRALGAHIVHRDACDGYVGRTCQAPRLEQAEQALARVTRVSVGRHQVVRVDGEDICLRQSVRRAVAEGDSGRRCTTVVDAVQGLAAERRFLRIDHELYRLDAGRDLSAVVEAVHRRLRIQVNVDVERRIGRVAVVACKGGQQRADEERQIAERVLGTFKRIEQRTIVAARQTLTSRRAHIAERDHVEEQPHQKPERERFCIRLKDCDLALRLLGGSEVVHIVHAVDLAEDVGDHIATGIA